MSPTLRLLVALVGGLALGTAIEASGSAPLRALVPWIEPLGTLFVNGIRMTIIPLVVTSLVVGITSACQALRQPAICLSPLLRGVSCPACCHAEATLPG